MSTRSDQLEVWKQIAQIVSALAIPVVLALIGFFVQRSLADAGLKKDYVQMALTVLKEQPNKENAELRQWAIAVLDKNSPVPIPSKLKSQLASSKWFEAFFYPDGFKYEETIECKPVPNPQTLEWLIANDPIRYTRCPNGQVGERMPYAAKYLKRPASAASGVGK
jgi:hypothetical protein